MSKICKGETLTLEGVTYTVLEVCRGEGQARTTAQRSTEKRYYRPIRGQWVVLKAHPPQLRNYEDSHHD